ncbi:MAG: hypothetical protein ACI8T1_002054 [Verrucomicrobiales bacterium]|jgi:hypothetical protein
MESMKFRKGEASQLATSVATRRNVTATIASPMRKRKGLGDPFSCKNQTKRPKIAPPTNNPQRHRAKILVMIVSIDEDPRAGQDFSPYPLVSPVSP